MNTIHRDNDSFTFTIEQRRSLVESYLNLPKKDNGKHSVSQRKYAQQINIDQSTLTKWIKKYMNGDYDVIPNGKQRKRARDFDYHEVEMKLVEYINLKMNERNPTETLDLTHRNLQKKALELASMTYEAGSDELIEFKASNGWISNVLRRNHLEGIIFESEVYEKSNDIMMDLDEDQAIEDLYNAKVDEILEEVKCNNSINSMRASALSVEERKVYITELTEAFDKVTQTFEKGMASGAFTSETEDAYYNFKRAVAKERITISNKKMQTTLR
jgi:transposase-like protein